MIEKFLNSLGDFFKKNNLLLVLFFLSTGLFFVQHHQQLSWDFSAYVLNARYFFSDGGYFEMLRPPLVPFIVGAFLFLGTFAEYLFILITCVLFLVAIVDFSDTIYRKKLIEKENLRVIFYSLALGVYALIYGFMAGTELISISFLTLFLSFVLKKKVSGHFLALGVLSRYNLFIFAPFLFFNKSYKTILKNFGLFVLIISPWLLFNYFRYGNFFASIIDSFTLNVLNRGYLYEPFAIKSLFLVIGWFFPFFIIGLFIAIRNILIKKDLRFESLVFVIVSTLILYDFMTTPQKDLRYLFSFVLPVIYFSGVGVIFLVEKFKKIKDIQMISTLFFFIVALITILILTIGFLGLNKSQVYLDAAKDIKSLGLENCEILSPFWVFVSYHQDNVYPYDDTSIRDLVLKNRTLLMFKNTSHIDFTPIDLNQFSDLVFYETKDYVFYSLGPVNCSPRYTYDVPYTRYKFCPNLARRMNGLGFEEEIEKLCFTFNRN
jgi:hypothetical protein